VAMWRSRLPIRVAYGEVLECIEQSREAIRRSLELLHSVPDFDGPLIAPARDKFGSELAERSSAGLSLDGPDTARLPHPPLAGAS
jgi:hypothetical protein